MLPTHYDLAVLLTVLFVAQFGCLTFLGWLAWKGPRDMAVMIKEAQRLTRAVAALVVQESEKIRSLFPEGRR